MVVRLDEVRAVALELEENSGSLGKSSTDLINPGPHTSASLAAPLPLACERHKSVQVKEH